MSETQTSDTPNATKNLHWLRFNYMEPILTQRRVEPCYFLRALRSDGQLFETHMFTDGTNIDAIHRDLRRHLETMLDRPALSPVVDEYGIAWPVQMPVDAYKGYLGWVEAV